MEKGIPPGISFDEFKVFCQFLNNLEDFTIAMRMYTLADHPISKGKKIKIHHFEWKIMLQDIFTYQNINSTNKSVWQL